MTEKLTDRERKFLEQYRKLDEYNRGYIEVCMDSRLEHTREARKRKWQIYKTGKGH